MLFTGFIGFFQIANLGCSKEYGTYGDPCGKSATYQFHEECAEGYYCEGYYPSFPRSHWAGDYCYCEDPESSDCDEPRNECAPDEMESCDGYCSPKSYFGDGYCDAAGGSGECNRNYNSPSHSMGSVGVDYNCPELNFDDGDCEVYNNADDGNVCAY